MQSNTADLRNKRVTVAGLGRFGGGIEVSRWLALQGAKVLVTDKESAAKLADSVEKLRGLPIYFRLGEHRTSDFTDCDLVVTSPAIPPTNEYLKAAVSAGVPVSTEIRLFIERCPARIIGVTGTKGKSTTSTLLGLMLKKRFTTWVGGNIGGSLLEKLPEFKPSDLVVLELSSYMLEHLRPAKWSPHVAVVTMITRDHTEWHDGFDNYVDSKKNIVRFQSQNDFSVLNQHDPMSTGFAKEAGGQVVFYGTENCPLFKLKLWGDHNQLNAQAAFTAANLFGVSWEEAQTAIADFAGLPHRLQLVHEINGVKYYNDSIATIPEAAIAALGSFPEKHVIQIVGGYDKHLPLSEMCSALARRAKAVLCIGATGPSIANAVKLAGGSNPPAIYECGDLETAVKKARHLVTTGDIVLLSTGCASYDQFANFESRGDAFTRLAKQA
ncbi:MAG TPA: UDP-N-acetylmuramoyl-L-alanine--D-glutamate ligase [Tepidisphaeraceae bacterium]|nr:UDP-N-acetylmuramoyl-L-alanine--D-glutamate ligase [Tepidisphaeraceae bacterium]